jgi:predicted transcriptional regulator
VNVRSRNRSRNKIEIICQILQVANGGVSTKIEIMYKVNLSYAQLKEYLVVLTKRNLLEYYLDTHEFKTTEKGLNLLKAYEQMNYVLTEKQM